MSFQKAVEALKRRDFPAARDIIARASAATYGVNHFLVRGLAELALKEWDAALATFAAATKRFPDNALFWLNRGIAEENLFLLEAAIASQERCLTLNPAQAEACGNLSNLYRHKLRFAEAEAMARRALAGGAAKGDALNCLGLALCRQGKFDEARKTFIQAHEADPDHAAAFVNHANLEVEVFDFEAAWNLFAAARALDDQPVFRHDEALARLLAGDFERGWELFESRLEMPRALRLHPPCPRWKGEDLGGKKLLIIAEQGFGDVIQFCRYQEFLTEGELVWAVPKSLIRLLTPVVHGAVLDERGPLPECDYYVPILSLALRTGKNRRDSLSPLLGGEGWGEGGLEEYTPASNAPLAPKRRTTPSALHLPTGKHQRKIGLVWAGSPTHLRDHERSIPLQLFAPFLSAVEADFYAPFSGAALKQIDDLPVTPLDSLINDFADTAALLRQLDCLVTVDTAAAHLAGSLGIKTFVLLPRSPDWRWGVAGDKTIWYPSLTLLRQPTNGDWQSVIGDLTTLVLADINRACS
ncbi:MAG: tetratricopeptide repeat protein [Alphaproteobacteria bacterium]|nr:tetratricopeptide repeat protein [Alphaproteobacteria bacterium]